MKNIYSVIERIYFILSTVDANSYILYKPFHSNQMQFLLCRIYSKILNNQLFQKNTQNRHFQSYLYRPNKGIVAGVIINSG